MAVHDFTHTPKTPKPVPKNEPKPLVPQKLDQHLPQPKIEITHDPINTDHADVNEHDVLGFRVFDEAIKDWLKDMFKNVPTVSSGLKAAEVRIAGENRAYLMRKADLESGRIKLPVVSVDRTSSSYYEEEFSPPYHPLRIRYTDCSRTAAAKIFRPVPYLLEYTISWWTEHKKDAEWMLYELLPRFNPLCEIVVEDTQWRGPLTMRLGDWKDDSDKSQDAKQKEFKKYVMDITAEAWLPLPDQIVKTVVGRVQTIEEDATPVDFTEDLYNNLNWASGTVNF